jgi:hypothetical protein
VKKQAILGFTALSILLLSLGCSSSSNINTVSTPIQSSIYDGTYSGTFNCTYRADSGSPWVTVTAFTLTLTLKTQKVNYGIDYLWVSHVYCSDPVYGTGTGIDMPDGYLTVASNGGAALMEDPGYNVRGYAYVWLPANTPSSVTSYGAFIINFPNGTCIAQAGISYSVNAGGTSISEESLPLPNGSKTAAWVSNIVTGGTVIPSAVPANIASNVNFQWLGLSWNLIKISP